MTDALERLIDKDEIRDLIHAYCHAVDRADIALLRAIALPDAPFDYGIFSGTAGAFADFVEGFLQETGPTHHSVTNIVIGFDGDGAFGQSYCVAMHGDVRDGESLVDLVVYVRYLDRFEKRDGIWKIAGRTVVYDWNQNLPRTARWEGPLHGQYLPRGGTREADPSDALALFAGLAEPAR